ncbi:CU044_2847 family protein [Mesorhizobium neociceri]|uniref:Trypsin-co-occurring domain-containing protein n=1 Tax=Mesorhizobium neociceri TaxID=1307853 RepID=A0A838BEE4_9HYPH|nr:CU044_2847 family protein [Mesorhizobium neociceri]MBA1144845.1 hypothetical protein [Mesorhizobium neociceri]
MVAGTKYVRFPVGDATMVVEVDAPAGTTPVSAASAVAKANETLENAIAKAARIISTMRSEMQQAISDAEQIEVGFGIKFSSELGVILAKSSLEANLQVTVTWKR